MCNLNLNKNTNLRLDNIEEDAIRNINIPTGEPFVYDFDADLKPIGEPDEHGFRGRFVGGKTFGNSSPAVSPISNILSFLYRQRGPGRVQPCGRDTKSD